MICRGVPCRYFVLTENHAVINAMRVGEPTARQKITLLTIKLKMTAFDIQRKRRFVQQMTKKKKKKRNMFKQKTSKEELSLLFYGKTNKTSEKVNGRFQKQKLCICGVFI